MWFWDNIDYFDITVASESDYTYNECNVDNINDAIDDMITMYAILYISWCIVRLVYIICATYTYQQHQFENQLFNKWLVVLHVVNVVVVVILEIYSTEVGLLQANDVTNGIIQEGSDVHVIIGFYQGIRVGITWAIDYAFFAFLILFFHMEKPLQLLNTTCNVLYFLVLFFCFFGFFVNTVWITALKDNTRYFVAEDIRFASVNAAIESNIHGYGLLNHKSLNMSTISAADILTNACALFEEKGENDVGETYYALRFTNVAGTQDVTEHQKMHGNINDYEYMYEFELYMYCEYTKQTKSLAECSIGVIENKQTDTIIGSIPIYFKQCNTAFFDLTNVKHQFDIVPTNEPYLELSVCYDEFVHSRKNPLQW